MTWGYGASGTFGFKTSEVKDRFHDCSHSDFFTAKHMRKYWVPLIVDGQVVLSSWSAKRPGPGFLMTYLNLLPLKSILGLTLFVAAYRLLA